MALQPVKTTDTTTAASKASLQAVVPSERQRLNTQTLNITLTAGEMASYNQRGNTAAGWNLTFQRADFKALDQKLGTQLNTLSRNIATYKDPKVKADANAVLARFRAEHNHQVWVASRLTGLAAGVKTQGVATPIPARKAALEAAKASFARAQVSRDRAMAAMKAAIGDPMKTDGVEQTSKLLFIANRDVAKALDDIRKAINADATMGETVRYLRAGSMETLGTMLRRLATPLTDAANNYSARLSAAVRIAKNNTTVTITTSDPKNGIATKTTKSVNDPAGVAALADRLNNNLEAFGAANVLFATNAQIMNSIETVTSTIRPLSPGNMLSGFADHYAKQYSRQGFDAWSRTANFNAVLASPQTAEQNLKSVDTAVRRPIRPGSIASAMEPNKMGQTTILANTVREVMSGLYARSTAPKAPNPIINIKYDSPDLKDYYQIDTPNTDTAMRRMAKLYEMQFRLAYRLPKERSGTGTNTNGSTFKFHKYHENILKNSMYVIFFKGNTDMGLTIKGSDIGHWVHNYNTASVDIYAKEFKSLRHFPFSLQYKVNGNVANVVASEPFFHINIKG